MVQPSFPSSKYRALQRLIDRSATPIWAIDHTGKLVFVSAGLATQLQVDSELLIGRLAVVTGQAATDPLDALAASLAAPVGIDQTGQAWLLVQPPAENRSDKLSIETLFLYLDPAHSAPAFGEAIGDPGSLASTESTKASSLAEGSPIGFPAPASFWESHRPFVLGIGGLAAPPRPDLEVTIARQLRQQLDSWNQLHHAIANQLCLGRSRAAERLRRQIDWAISRRADLLIAAPPGCLGESLARDIQNQCTRDEPLVAIDGPLMDAELLDASLTPALHHLMDSKQHLATVLVKELDETPLEAQAQLLEHLRQYGDRLRLIALTSPDLKIASQDESNPHNDPMRGGFETGATPEQTLGVLPRIADRFCGPTIVIEPLHERVDDLPLMATTILHQLRAGGDCDLDRFSQAAMDAMVLYPWPNNYVELQQAIQHAASKASAASRKSAAVRSIEPEHFPLAIRSYRPTGHASPEVLKMDLDHEVARYEAALILKTLEQSDGNRAEAARRLNISRARLLRKLETIEQNPTLQSSGWYEGIAIDGEQHRD